MNILIRCDGTKDGGIDHIFKYLAFADKLRSLYQCTITFAMRNNTHCINIVKEKYPVLTPHIDDERLNEQEWIYNLTRLAYPDILILDNKDALTSETLGKIKRKRRIKVLVADIYIHEEKAKLMKLESRK